MKSYGVNVVCLPIVLLWAWLHRLLQHFEYEWQLQCNGDVAENSALQELQGTIFKLVPCKS